MTPSPYTEDTLVQETTVPHLFHHNAVVMFGNGEKAKIGTLISEWAPELNLRAEKAGIHRRFKCSVDPLEASFEPPGRKQASALQGSRLTPVA